MGYIVYKKHRTSKNWKKVGSYAYKRTAQKHARAIRDGSPNMHAKIKKVK